MSDIDFQVGVLNLLARHGEMSGRDLRAALKAEFGIIKYGPAFYQAMAHMEDGGSVKIERRTEIVEGHAIKISYYNITEIGRGQRKFQGKVEKSRDGGTVIGGEEATAKVICR